MLSISPDDLSDIVNRWRSPPGMSGQTWVDYILVITEILAIAAALLLFCLGWVTYQRRQIRARARVEQALSDQLRFVEALTDCMPRRCMCAMSTDGCCPATAATCRASA